MDTNYGRMPLDWFKEDFEEIVGRRVDEMNRDYADVLDGGKVVAEDGKGLKKEWGFRAELKKVVIAYDVVKIYNGLDDFTIEGNLDDRGSLEWDAIRENVIDGLATEGAYEMFAYPLMALLKRSVDKFREVNKGFDGGKYLAKLMGIITRKDMKETNEVAKEFAEFNFPDAYEEDMESLLEKAIEEAREMGVV